MENLQQQAVKLAQEKLNELNHKAQEERNWLTAHPHADIEVIRHHREVLQTIEAEIKTYEA